MSQQIIRFGIIGGGLMAREFASACLRWAHLLNLDARPVITAVADASGSSLPWFRENIPGLRIASTDYCDFVASNEVDAVYCAVPHNVHARIFCDVINEGKHLFGEKPFGINLAANTEILNALRAHPEVFARCSTQLAFYPGPQQIIKFIREGRFGKIIEVEAGFWHSSDLDPLKPINWKRQAALNGEYGCMGDLGLHVLYVPLRFGWMPYSVRALLSKIVRERPDAAGKLIPCDTWDNAILACDVQAGDDRFPMLLSMKRIAPGETNTWFLKIVGTEFSAEFSTKYPKTLRTLAYRRGEPQAWQVLDLGYQSAYPAITGPIFEFGFPDAILQMLAAFCDELVHRDAMRQPFGCATPAETAQHHRVLTAALDSQRTGETIRPETL